MAGKFALIIGSSHYDDPSLGRLRAPDLDAHGLEEVLKSSAIGQFDEVVTLLNEGATTVRKAIARFYDRRQRDDLLLLYFSGHGVKDEQGNLYLALRDTELALLAGSALETAFIATRMDRSFSKRQVLVLDCCHSGAFSAGAKSAQGASVGTAEAFEGTGLGRVILTATDSAQYAWEGDRIIGDAQSSLFTHFLVDGLRTGAADRNRDGVVTVDELYDYVREQVVEATPRQTPRKWTYRQEGDIVVARNPFARDPTLPLEIEEARNSKLPSGRQHAVHELEKLLRGQDETPRAAALAALKELALDDSRKVANAAIQALKAYEREQQVDSLGQLAAEAPRHGEDGIAVEAPERQQQNDALAPAHARSERDPSDIFISYEHHDRKQARALANALTAQGWTVWWDRRIAPGEAFDVVIERELATSRCVIVLWSTRSVRATWVKNEARRAARRAVLVPVLIEAVEPPLEFDNLQAADLTTWDEVNTEHLEFAAVLDRVQALAPSSDRAARMAVEHARREWAAGRPRHAIASLEQFQPANTLVTQALSELTAEAARIDAAHVEALRREHERAQRAQRFAAATAQIEDHLGRGELDVAEQALLSGEQEFGPLPVWTQVRERLSALREQARHEQLAREQLQQARRDQLAREQLEQARRDQLAREQLEQARRDQLAREQLEQARQEAEAQKRQPEATVEEAGHEEPPEPPRPTPPDVVEAVKSPRHGWSTLGLRGVYAAAAILLLVGATGIVFFRPVPAMHATQPGEARNPLTSDPAVAGPPVLPSVKPTEPAVLPSTGRDIFLPASPEVRNDKPEVTTANESPAPPAVNVEEIRARARGQRQSGDHVQALKTVVDGLRLAPNDAGLNGILTALLADARSGAARSKQEAVSLEASDRAAEPFARGLRNEGEAARLQRTGRVDAAVRAWWTATDQFKAATAHARKVADEEAEEQQRIEEKPAQRDDQPQRPQSPTGSPRPLPDSGIEQNLVNAALRRYEAAHGSLNAQAVKDVYPAAPVDQLTREFAGCQSYVLRIEASDYRFLFTDSLWIATVPATVSFEITPKAGKPTRGERSQTFQLVKQGNAWVIRQIR
jgi:hypothetical protein